MAAWFVVATEPQAEAAVSTRAGDLSIEAYFPKGQRVVRRSRRESVAVARPAMPGYVFVMGEHFSAFRRHLDGLDAVPHCLGWLSGANGPEALDGAQVDILKTREARGEFDQHERIGRYWAPRWLKPRAKVHIVAGPLRGMAGEVWRLTGARQAVVWVVMLGAPRLAECSVDWLARAR